MSVFYGSFDPTTNKFTADAAQPSPYTYGTSGGLLPTPGAKPGEPGSPAVAPSDASASPDTSNGYYPRTATDSLGDGTVTASTPQSVDEIQADKMKRAQAQIDALNRYYSDLSAEQQTVNEKNDRSTAAVSTLSGLAGSTEADSAQRSTTSQGQQALGKIKNEQAVAIQGILSKIQEDAVAEARQQRLDYNASVSDTITNRTNVAKMQSDSLAAAGDHVKNLTAAGVTPDGLKTSDPTSYAYLLKQYGGDESALKGAFVLNTPQDQILDKKIVGSTYVISRQNPITGKITVDTLDIPGLPANYSASADLGNRIMFYDPSDPQGKQFFVSKGLTPKDAADLAANSPGSGTVNNPQYAGVVDTILGSGKFTKDQATAVKRAINNGEDPATVIKNQAKNIMGQTEATTVTKYETAKSSLQDIEQNLKDFYAAGGKTGIFTGNFEKVINNLGRVNDPKLVDLATQIQANLQIYRNAVSGTAYSEQEGADISRIFPGINKSEGLNAAILKGRMTAFDATIDGTYRSTLGSAYDKLKAAEAKNAEGNASAAKTLVKNGQAFDASALTPEEYQAALKDGYTSQ